MKTYLYKDNETNNIYTLEEIRSQYMEANNSDIEISYKEMENIIFAELVQNGGSISIVNDDLLELCNKIADNKEADRYLTQYERDFSALYNYRLLNELLEVYNDFIYREYESEPIKELPSVLDLAYTTTEIGEHEIQVCYDIEEERYKHFLDGGCLSEEDCNLREFIEDLKNSSFESYINSIWWLANREEEGEEEA